MIDVYRGANKAQKNFGKVLLYISFFPQLIAGPIVKYHDVEQEIEHRTQSADGVAKGIRRFIAGLSKKVPDLKCDGHDSRCTFWSSGRDA